MTTFYFVRHGEMDNSMAGKLFYQEFAQNMMALTEKGVAQIHETAKDPRLKDAKIIISSPFSRALHSAAILSKELYLEIKVEPEVHEWLPNVETYRWVGQEVADNAYKELVENHGVHPEGKKCTWESTEMMKTRVKRVLEKYLDYDKVIVVCHGTLMQFILDSHHAANGEIMETTWEEFIKD